MCALLPMILIKEEKRGTGLILRFLLHCFQSQDSFSRFPKHYTKLCCLAPLYLQIALQYHTYSAKKYPHLADRGEVIFPTTFQEHLHDWHGGNWNNSLPGKRIKSNRRY